MTIFCILTSLCTLKVRMYTYVHITYLLLCLLSCAKFWTEWFNHFPMYMCLECAHFSFTENAMSYYSTLWWEVFFSGNGPHLVFGFILSLCRFMDYFFCSLRFFQWWSIIHWVKFVSAVVFIEYTFHAGLSDDVLKGVTVSHKSNWTFLTRQV